MVWNHSRAPITVWRVGDTGWRLILNGVTVAEVLRESRSWIVAGEDDPRTTYRSIAEAVASTPQARALDRRGVWEVETRLHPMTAFELLDEPALGVQEVKVNGVVFAVLTDERGRFLFNPVYWPPEGQEDQEETVLQIGLNSPGHGGFTGSPCSVNWIQHLRGVYRLTSSEEAVYDDVAPSRYDSDLEACRGLMTRIDGRVCSFVWSGRDQLRDADVKELISSVECPYGVVWFDYELWRSGFPPVPYTRASAICLPGEPTQVWREIEYGVWVSGVLSATDDAEVAQPDRPWYAVLVQSEADLATLLAADFAANEFEDSGYRHGVVVELPGGPMLGLQIELRDLTDSKAMASVYAEIIGGALLEGDDARLRELRADGTTSRAWTWRPTSRPVPAAAGVINDSSDLEKQVERWYDERMRFVIEGLRNSS